MTAADLDAIGPAKFVRTLHGDAFTEDRAAVVFLKDGDTDTRWCRGAAQP